MKKFFPNQKLELLTIPFYIFFVLSFSSTIGRIINIANDNSASYYNFNQFWLILLIIIGMILCFASIVIFTYANFFEKSFPSCITIKNNEPLNGLYKYIRHPSYYIFFSVTFGNALCLLSTPLFLLACINHVCLYYYYMIEEKQFEKTNADYKDYLRNSNRFLPNFLKHTIHA